MGRLSADFFTDNLTKGIVAVLPSPFTIALALTGFTFVLAFFIGVVPEEEPLQRLSVLCGYWYDGLWNKPLLAFAVQGMLMLVLGHVIALSPSIASLIDRFVKGYCNATSRAAFTVTLLTVIAGLLNWGLGLVFGAIMARKVGEIAFKQGRTLNYGLIGAAGYSGMLVWHGGISGISMLKAAEPGHLRSMVSNTSGLGDKVPEVVTISSTMLSPLNLSVTVALILVLPTLMYLLGKHVKETTMSLQPIELLGNGNAEQIYGAERIDTSKLAGRLLGILVLGYAIISSVQHPSFSTMGFIDPDRINFFLFGFALVLHGTFSRFLGAVDKAISGVAGILIQFPLYFGIMGLMTQSGLVHQFADFFVNISTAQTLPLYTFFSASAINIFVPSGGGQWAIQGPVIVQSATQMGASLEQCILAMAYGDQLTNMLQPFWALPLLGITGLKAREILPYSVLLMLPAGMVMTIALLLFA